MPVLRQPVGRRAVERRVGRGRGGRRDDDVGGDAEVGSTYRITAFGVSSSNYDIRYDPGTMTVK
ncbi:MAG: hypothetical protein U0232_26160 [Thermomicrobiales bacterium]